MTKWIYEFNQELVEGDRQLKNTLGGKGANLAEMCKMELPVPPGFTISTDLCNYYYRNNKNFPSELWEQILASLDNIEKLTDKKFGSINAPLLLSIRSGSRASMPGMMDTILNLGLNDITVIALSEITGNQIFALDSYRRFIQMYGNVVLKIHHYKFEDIIEEVKRVSGLNSEAQFTVKELNQIIAQFKEIVEKETKAPFPQDIHTQLKQAITSVLDSWMNNRAKIYRKLHNIPEYWGTAVNVQAMVFGNMGNDSATGVMFTRNPSNGSNSLYGEFLLNAQGEDVVAGTRTPLPICHIEGQDSLEKIMPEAYEQLLNLSQKLELHYRDMQDIEFTIEQGKLYLLQTRSGKRAAQAAIKIAVDMVAEGIFSPQEAIMKIDPESLNQLLHTTVDPDYNGVVLTKGLPASPGAASGVIAFSAQEAEDLAQNQKVILVRADTSPEDIKGMHVAEGILTSRGGMTSHAAVVARGMGKTCVCGASELQIDAKNRRIIIGEQQLKPGDIITIDGLTGNIYLGQVELKTPELSSEFDTLMQWADGYRRMQIRANAETILDASNSLKFGAEGIGLCRTEHMFFEPDKILLMRMMILAIDFDDRQHAIKQLKIKHSQDFYNLFSIMQELPVNIRLLDPPLHEFLPVYPQDIELLSQELNISELILQQRIDALHEQNPMLGHRGCRLGITHPEIYNMQIEAILEAAQKVIAEDVSSKLQIEIMIPFIQSAQELKIFRERIEEMIREYTLDSKINIKIGTMIELPRAAILAQEIAEYSDYFSFGTNDLTQTTLGISRDDGMSFLGEYYQRNIMPNNPFVTIDTAAVGYLIKHAIVTTQNFRFDISYGICGEHGGDPESIDFCEQVGMNYVSCSPFRIPVARLAAAQAAIRKIIPFSR